jgi:DNA modification methylase
VTPKPYYEDPVAGLTLYCGDCRDILPQLDAVNHVITDPPYGVTVYQRMRSADSAGGNRRLAIKNQSSLVAMANGDIGHLDDGLIDSVAKHLAVITNRWLLVFSDAESNHIWRDALSLFGARYIRTGAWLKPDAMPQMTGDRPGVGFEICTIAHGGAKLRWNGGGLAALWRHNIVKGAARPDHPCPKPLPLMLELVSLFTDPGETILDPFAGSGTTLVAAKTLGRKAIGIELEEKWCATTVRRLKATEYKPPLGLYPAIKGKALPLLNGAAL